MKRTTRELLELMKNSEDYNEYRNNNKNEFTHSFMKTDIALSAILKEKGLKKSDVIARSGIETHYAYQIFSGVKTPTRDKVVMLCFGLSLSAEETQELLKITGYPQLYGRNERDNAILFGITKHISIIEMNNLLYDLNLEILI